MPEPLVVRRDHPGVPPRVVEPVPEFAIVTLPGLFSVVAREWCLALADDELEVAGHRFAVVGWDDTTPPAGLIVAHLPAVCCRPTPVPGP